MGGALGAPLHGYGRSMTGNDDSKMDDVKDALARDLEQTKHDLPGMEGKDLGQDATDTIKQAMGKDGPQ